jgi:hypothetical protein
MKTIKWTGTRGNEFELRAECKITLIEKILDADGQKIPTSEYVEDEEANLEAYIDGKRVGSSWNTDFWEIIDVTGTSYKRIWGIEKMGMTAKQAEKVELFLNEVIAEGTTEEVKEARIIKDAKEKARIIKNAKEIIAKAEAQNEIPTAEEYKTYRKNYNNLHNEGGEGYIPTMITKEEYDYAKSIVG